ncbi:class I SAM-dependent methyltransferase [Streptomyces noursei]|uniref:class I SAM-dependent methyltransferase n=1 Tax=Streptomyces noursei TaxID=1971 RepID=UPI00081CD482|nr:Mycinamicin VI 2''-O-methyltransferase [Streptomyces noursei ATCC 11455]
MTEKFDFDEQFIRDVIHASGDHGGELGKVVAEHGRRKVAQLLVEEVISRAAPAVNDTPVLLEFAISDGEHVLTYYLRVEKGEPVAFAAQDDGFVGMRVEYELSELVRELYGPIRERSAGVRGTKLFPYVEKASAFEQMGSYFLATQQATQTLLEGCSSAKPNLSELSSRYITPKFGSLHWFTPHYDRHFREYRGEQVRVLEIGIGGYRVPTSGGGSLRMWKHFFPRGQIYGLDIVDKSHVNEPRIIALQGDQSDAESLNRIAERHGPFDIIIDDGSHINQHVQASFEYLFPHVKPGGLYVIEDMWTAYWPGFGGNVDPAASSGTSLGLLKSLIDAIQHQELPETADRQPSYADQNVVGVHAYHNVAFIEKGRNAEGGVPPWIPRDFESLVAASSGEPLPQETSSDKAR